MSLRTSAGENYSHSFTIIVNAKWEVVLARSPHFGLCISKLFSLQFECCASTVVDGTYTCFHRAYVPRVHDDTNTLCHFYLLTSFSTNEFNQHETGVQRRQKVIFRSLWAWMVRSKNKERRWRNICGISNKIVVVRGTTPSVHSWSLLVTHTLPFTQLANAFGRSPQGAADSEKIVFSFY